MYKQMEVQKYTRRLALKHSIPYSRLERLFCQKIIHIDEGSYCHLAKTILSVARFKRYGLVQMMSMYFSVPVRRSTLQSDMMRFFQTKTFFAQFTGPPYCIAKPF